MAATRLAAFGCACAILLTAVAAQSQGPFENEPAGRPVSAQQSQLTGSDPTGRGAVLVRPLRGSFALQWHKPVVRAVVATLLL